MDIKIPIGHEGYQTFPFQGLPKRTKISIFGMLQIYHLATLLQMQK
jgi:hypothetical protein